MNKNNFPFTAIGILILLGYGCQKLPTTKENEVFKIPVVINSQLPDTLPSIPYKAEFVSEVFPKFMGKYAFQDSIDLNEDIRRSDTTYNKDLFRERSSLYAGDTIDVNGFEMFVDYETTINCSRFYGIFDSILHQYYPVYFVNSTQSDKMFMGKDSHVFGIQEASDSEKYGSWRPIEAQGFDFCGNGDWSLIVHPKEFVVVLMRKYEGDFRTQIRVRIKVGENIYVSLPFYGQINKNQRHIEDGSRLQMMLRKSNGADASWLFYGARMPEINKQMD